MTTFHLPTFPPNQSYSDKDLNQPIRSQVGRHATKQSKQRECFCCGTEHSANVLLPRHAALTPWNARGALSTTTTANNSTEMDRFVRRLQSKKVHCGPHSREVRLSPKGYTSERVVDKTWVKDQGVRGGVRNDGGEGLRMLTRMSSGSRLCSLQADVMLLLR